MKAEQYFGSNHPATPAYSGNSEAKMTKQQGKNEMVVTEEVKRMMDLTSLEMPFDKAALREKSGKPTGEIPMETTGRYNQTAGLYR